MDPDSRLNARAHLQDFHSAQNLEHHWGYADRVVPCTNDAKTCEYLDSVYHSHDLSMLYSWILWVVLFSFLVVLIVLRYIALSPASSVAARSGSNVLSKVYRTLSTHARCYLLPETSFPGLWRRITRLQVLILSIFLAYLLVFSMVGITYKTWITPVKSDPSLKSTRSGLGGWSDRVGVLAYALTPLAVFLSARESVLSLATGIPAQNFIFLHAWTGRIIFVQSFLHTLGWTLIEGYFYKPQPYMYTSVMSQQYIIFGCVAMFFITVLLIFSLQRVIKWTGYEVFRKLHYGVAFLYIGACWGHWEQLACWMIASLIVVALDRAVRLLRVLKVHLGRSASDGGLLDIYPLQACVTVASEDTSAETSSDPRSVLRLDIPLSSNHRHQLQWKPSQHFYVCFPELSVWQSHPFTAISSPDSDELSFIIRTHTGETAGLLAWARDPANIKRTISVVLTGPYGPSPLQSHAQENILAIAGGTGITYTLPLALRAVSSGHSSSTLVDVAASANAGMVEHIWIVRHADDLAWLPECELQRVRTLVRDGKLRFRVFVTREAVGAQLPAGLPVDPAPLLASASGTDALAESGQLQDMCCSRRPTQGSGSHAESDDTAWISITYADGAEKHPSIRTLLSEFIEHRAVARVPTTVLASGPTALLGDVRAAAAECNHGARVWRGEEKWGVQVWCDGRMG